MKKQLNIPKAKQLPSGSWFCRVRANGQDISITRATEKEVVAEAMAIKAGVIEAQKAPKKKTLTTAIDEYIEARRNILSPSTIRGYRAIQKNRFSSMMQKDIFEVTQDQWQRAVNQEAKRITAKTLTNSWRFVASVITETTGQHITVRLPQIIPSERPWLTPEQIPDFVVAVKGDRAEIPALLALSSLRRSEIIGLRWSDVDLENGIIKINGAAVQDEHHKIVYKRETKNTTSRRTVPIIPPLKKALESAVHSGEYVVKYRPATVMQQVNRVCERNGFPKTGLHGLRHSFASLAYHLGIPEKVAMEIGGWADNQTMHKIYTHISEKSITSAAKAFTGFFSPQDGKNGNENDNEK